VNWKNFQKKRIKSTVEITVIIYADGVHKETFEIDQSTTYEDVLKTFDINPETIIVLQRDMPQPLDKLVSPEGEIKILRIVSGG
jgi:sulfur carrier protein ThiS